VEGNISGKSLRKTGSRNSMKGTMMKRMKGTRRNRSAQVLKSCGDTGDTASVRKPTNDLEWSRIELQCTD